MSVIAKGSFSGRFLRRLTGRAWLGLRSTPRSRTYPVLGAFLALAMALGLPVVHALEAGRVPTLAWALNDITRLSATYAYVTLSSLAVVTALGYLLGHWFDRAQHLSITDPLTGLFNRRYFGERLTAEMGRARRKGHPTSVLCLDVDHLKAINDSLGHRAGDCALVAVAGTLSNSVRQTDVVARFGGDEFAVLLPETGAAEASALSSRIVTEISRRRQASTGPIEISIGVSELSATADPNDVLAAADAALYRAKAAGGGQAAMTQMAPAASPDQRPTLMREAALPIKVREIVGQREMPSLRHVIGTGAPRATLHVIASEAEHPLDGAMRVGINLVCAACQSDHDVQSQDEFGDLGFCHDCLARARNLVTDEELGGEC